MVSKWAEKCIFYQQMGNSIWIIFFHLEHLTACKDRNSFWNKLYNIVLNSVTLINASHYTASIAMHCRGHAILCTSLQHISNAQSQNDLIFVR